MKHMSPPCLHQWNLFLGLTTKSPVLQRSIRPTKLWLLTHHTGLVSHYDELIFWMLALLLFSNAHAPSYCKSLKQVTWKTQLLQILPFPSPHLFLGAIYLLTPLKSKPNIITSSIKPSLLSWIKTLSPNIRSYTMYLSFIALPTFVILYSLVWFCN